MNALGGCSGCGVIRTEYGSGLPVNFDWQLALMLDWGNRMAPSQPHMGKGSRSLRTHQHQALRICISGPGVGTGDNNKTALSTGRLIISVVPHGLSTKADFCARPANPASYPTNWLSAFIKTDNRLVPACCPRSLSRFPPHLSSFFTRRKKGVERCCIFQPAPGRTLLE